MRYKSLILLLTLFSYFNLAFTQISDSTELDLLSLSFSELLNLKVSIADKNEKSVLDAPGSITAYNSDAISNLGSYTLDDLSKVTPGYSSYSIFGERVFETRGTKAGSFNNNKHLVLIDGIPVNHARNYRAPSAYDLPLFFAEQVEFLRGPGSALYGVSAFNGAISIDSKRLSENGARSEGMASYGSPRFGERLMINLYHKTDNGEAQLSVGYYHKNSDGDFVGHDSLAPDSLFRNWNSQKSLFFNSSYRIDQGALSGVKLGVIYMNKTGSLGEFWWGPSSDINELTWETLIPYVKYNKELNQKWNLNTYLKLNRGIEKGAYANNSFYSLDSTASPISTNSNDVIMPLTIFSEYNAQVNNSELFAELKYKIDNRSSVLVGINHDIRMQVAGPSSYEIRALSPDSTGFSSYKKIEWEASELFNTFSIFGQYNYSLDFMNGLDVVLGFRNDYGYTSTNKYDRLSPRISLIQKLSDKLSIKALYGSALRAPGIKEVELNKEVKNELGNNASFLSELHAEYINSYEGSINYLTHKLQTSITLFQNTTSHALDGASATVDGVSYNYFKNSTGHWTSIGFEYDIKYIASQKLSLLCNVAYAQAENEKEENFYGVPQFKWNSILFLKNLINDRVNISITNRYINGYYIGNDLLSETINIIDVNSSLKIDKNIRFELQLKNLLNQSFKQPGGNGSRYDIPLAKRYVIGSVIAEF